MCMHCVGRLDNATRRLMKQPRCGLPDIETSDDDDDDDKDGEGEDDKVEGEGEKEGGGSRRRKRYAAGTHRQTLYLSWGHAQIRGETEGVTCTSPSCLPSHGVQKSYRS